MQAYQQLLQDVLSTGRFTEERTGTGTLATFGKQLHFDLTKGFPLVTTKKVHFKSIVHELIWFLRGDTNIKYLNDNGVRIWDEWASPDGELGPVYGKQWRRWETPDGKVIDQISNVIHQLKNNPTSRRIIVTAWNPGEVDSMALPPCHLLFQFNTQLLTHDERIAELDRQVRLGLKSVDGLGAYPDKKALDDLGVPTRGLACLLYQRSADLFLGVPFNIASYALLTHLLAHECNMAAQEFVWTGGNCHIYQNHLEQVNTQLGREPLPLPELVINPNLGSVLEVQFEDIELRGYEFHPAIKAKVAV